MWVGNSKRKRTAVNFALANAPGMRRAQYVDETADPYGNRRQRRNAAKEARRK